MGHEMSNKLKIHPECARWPRHGANDPEEWRMFVEGIRQHKETGVRVTIWSGPFGDEVIDGRSSYEAALEVGAKIDFVRWVPPNGAATAEAINEQIHYYTVMLNTNRRGASVQLAAMVCASFLVEKHGDIPRGEIRRESERTGISTHNIGKAIQVVLAGEKYSDAVMRGASLVDTYEAVMAEKKAEERKKQDAEKKSEEIELQEVIDAPETPPIPVKPEETDDASEHVRKMRKSVFEAGENVRALMRLVSKSGKQWLEAEATLGEFGVAQGFSAVGEAIDDLAKRIGKASQSLN